MRGSSAQGSFRRSDAQMAMPGIHADRYHVLLSQSPGEGSSHHPSSKLVVSDFWEEVTKDMDIHTHTCTHKHTHKHTHRHTYTHAHT